MSLTPAEEALLRERAKALATPARAAVASQAGDELLVVSVGQARYALPLARLAGVVTLPRLTPLPGAPPFIAGLAHVQGRTLTVVSLGVLLGHPPQPTRLGALVDVGGESFALGVAAVEGVRSMWSAGEDAVPAGVGPGARRVIQAVGPGGVCLVDLNRLIEDMLTSEAPSPRNEP
jgi:purine-binding chemotaxis protein CheW